MHTNSMDEALALPSEKAVRIALRTQQIIAHESGVANTVDPLGGSFIVESLTNQMEEAAYGYFGKIDSLGGVISAIEQGFLQKEVAQSAYRYQQEIEGKERIVVGVNDYVLDEVPEIPILSMIEEGRERHIARLNEVRRQRDNRAVRQRLDELHGAAKGDTNLMPYLLEAVRDYATLGEICDVLRHVFGEYHEVVIV